MLTAVCNCSNVKLSSSDRHDLLDEPVGEAQLDQLALEQRLCRTAYSGSMSGRRDEPRRRVEHDAAIAIDDARAKRDRRDVPFAGRPQAQDESLRALRHARLVGMPDHRRVEQRRRLERVLLREVRADQQLAVLAQRRVGQQELPRVLEPVKKELPRLLVPAVELGEQVVHKPVDFLLGERHDPGHDPQRPLRIGKLERPEQHPRVVRLDENVGSLHVHCRLPCLQHNPSIQCL